jgi:ribulose-phosphate 3-epimerase
MTKCSTSLWSADLANLGSEIRRVEPYSERLHIDVADGHYVPNLLFFPDQVKALRPHSRLPFEVHLMTTDPLAWVAPFAEAGADIIIFCLDSTADPRAVLEAIKRSGRQAGVSLLISEGVASLDGLWDLLDVITVVGTAMGIKGAGMDPGIPGKIRQLRDIIDREKLEIVIEADGGIRRETVPLLRAAGADFIVPGSLIFKEDPAEMRRWLASLG